jgi:hypothetical protein
MFNRPENRKENGGTTKKIYNPKDIMPCYPGLRSWGCFLEDNHSNIVQDLQWNNNKKNFLLSISEYRLNEIPSSTD